MRGCWATAAGKAHRPMQATQPELGGVRPAPPPHPPTHPPHPTPSPRPPLATLAVVKHVWVCQACWEAAQRREGWVVWGEREGDRNVACTQQDLGLCWCLYAWAWHHGRMGTHAWCHRGEGATKQLHQLLAVGQQLVRCGLGRASLTSCPARACPAWNRALPDEEVGAAIRLDERLGHEAKGVVLSPRPPLLSQPGRGNAAWQVARHGHEQVGDKRGRGRV
jgi:hypothetical protein